VIKNLTVEQQLSEILFSDKDESVYWSTVFGIHDDWSVSNLDPTQITNKRFQKLKQIAKLIEDNHTTCLTSPYKTVRQIAEQLDQLKQFIDK